MSTSEHIYQTSITPLSYLVCTYHPHTSQVPDTHLNGTLIYRPKTHVYHTSDVPLCYLVLSYAYQQRTLFIPTLNSYHANTFHVPVTYLNGTLVYRPGSAIYHTPIIRLSYLVLHAACLIHTIFVPVMYCYHANTLHVPAMYLNGTLVYKLPNTYTIPLLNLLHT